MTPCQKFLLQIPGITHLPFLRKDHESQTELPGPNAGRSEVLVRLRAATLNFVDILEKDKRDGHAGRTAPTLTRIDLVILDELGYLPFSQASGTLLFHLLSKLYGHTSIITTNLSFSE